MEKADFTRYEVARILGARALQIAMDAPLLLKISEEDLDKWGEVIFKVRRAKEMDIAPLPGVMEVEMIYGNNIMRTRIQRAS